MIQSFDVTPDGKQIVFDRLRENSDIVMIALVRCAYTEPATLADSSEEFFMPRCGATFDPLPSQYTTYL